MPSKLEMPRRKFLGMVAIGAAGASAGLSEDKAPSIAKPNAGAVPVALGEPYALAGKRLFFQNWYYIRPGTFAWTDKSGRSVGVSAAVPPGDASFVTADEPYGIRLVAQPAQRVGPLVEAERPWEGGAGVYMNTIIKDGGMYRAWGSPWTGDGDAPGQNHFYYLESNDGFTWKRPSVGIVEFNGSRANNILNILEIRGGSVFVDPSAAPSERYKFIGHGAFYHDSCEAFLRRRPDAWDVAFRGPKKCGGPGDRIDGLKGGVSGDGLHWAMFPEPMVVERTDTQVTAYYDEALRKYVMYTRIWPCGHRSTRVPADRRAWGTVARRAIARSESSNYREFPLHQTVLEPGPELLPSDTFYASCKTAMPGAPDHHLLFPTVWNGANDYTSVAVASSHDGKLWHLLSGSPVFSPGPFGTWDGGCVFASPNLLELSDGRFALPYTGYNVPHKYPRKLFKFAPGYAIWPKGRLVALEAPGRGEFATVGIVPPGRTLRINALTLRAGHISVEVATLDGKPVPGRSFAEASPIVGDHHWTTVTWGEKEDLGHKEDTGIFLRFRMDQAQLFGLEFA